MIDIPVHNMEGLKVGSVALDEQLLGGEVRPALLKQAYCRLHANRRSGTAKTKRRGEIAYSTRKLYKQKGTGNARRGSAGTNLMYHGAHGHSKKPRSFRQDMPAKMRKLANRNALLAKAVDGEIKLIESLSLDQPSTGKFAALLQGLSIDRTCLLALTDTHDSVARSARNIDSLDITRIDQLNVFDVLNHRYLIADRAAFERFVAGQITAGGNGQETR